jgi:hypothetical protein
MAAEYLHGDLDAWRAFVYPDAITPSAEVTP